MNRTLPNLNVTIDPISRMRSCVLFAGLTEEQLAKVDHHSRVVDLAEGRVLFEQEQPAHEFFLLTDGQVKLARYSVDGNEKIIDIIMPGQSFAEAIMFARQPVYPVTAAALVPSQVICFDAETYTAVLHESTEACFAIMAQMSRRLHWQIAEIDRLTLHGATFRVVTYLLDQLPSNQPGANRVRLDTPKHVIAARLSITPETLSRSFSRLTRDGLIEVKDNAITLKDVDRLRRFTQLGSY
jgi:CRP-like cAMP-binding protein